MTSGLGEFNGLDYVAAGRTMDGVTVVAYLPIGRTITVDLSKVSGIQAKASWYDPQTGKATPAGQFPTMGQKDFTPPDNNDWVLVVDDASKEFPAPGQFQNRM